MTRPAYEVADIVRHHGEAYRRAHAPPFDHRRVLQAVASCRTAALGGHVEQCGHCDHIRVCYNSCRNRHCPKCQSLARARWLQARLGELLPVEYFHVVFTLPPEIAAIGLQNKAAVYNLLFRTSAQTLLTIAKDPRHLGAEPGFFSVLHTWGQNLLHHPHVHCVVTGGGLSPDGEQWIACRPGFFLPVRVLSRLFRRLFLEGLDALHADKGLVFFGDLQALADPAAWARYLQPPRAAEWVVYAKPPFAGAAQAVAYLSRYTHRVALDNRRLLEVNAETVTFQWKDYRSRHKQKSRRMTLDGQEFLRRFLLHTLPRGFQRIRHYGFLASCHRTAKLQRIGQLLSNPVSECLPVVAAIAASAPPIAGPYQPRCPQCGRREMKRLDGVPRCWWDRPGWNSS